ncbi:MAG: DegT/DnrJ/EryC1/StrS aminotransferase family protein [Leptospirales bacterium]|nr:DegT/DnrJ/EryC1/StrS aminotransferase family protein [Leptospirales bacterium]
MASPGLYLNLNEKKARPIEAARPSLSKQELESVLNCLIEDRLDQADITRRFERSFASSFAFKHALAVNSLAAAYHLAFLALELDQEDAVLMSALAPAPACDAARYCRATPVLIDLARSSFHPDGEAFVQRAVELRGAAETPRRVAAVLDHSFGAPFSPDVAQLNQNGVLLIEDITGLAGSEREGEYFGKSAQIAVCGLSENDLLTTGNGAMIVTQDSRLYKRMHALRYGAKRESGELAFDYRLGDFQAAMGLDQLSRLGVTLARRKKIGQKYLDSMRSTSHETYFRNPGIDAYLRFPVVVNKSHDEIMRYFNSLQIGVLRAAEPPLHHLLGLARLEYPNAERIYQKSICVPVYPALTANNVERIAASLRGLI